MLAQSQPSSAKRGGLADVSSGLILLKKKIKIKKPAANVFQVQSPLFQTLSSTCLMVAAACMVEVSCAVDPTELGVGQREGFRAFSK